MKTFKLIGICLMLFNFSYGQQQDHIEKTKIKESITGFLNWYKKNGTSIEKTPIITGFNPDTIKKDSVIKVNMIAVEEYLLNLKKSNFVSDTFIQPLRLHYKMVSDSLVKHPIIDYYGPIGGLESDLIFGFEPAETLDHIKEGRFTKIFIVYDKAIVKFEISKFNQCIFTMTKTDGRWLIDYFGNDNTNVNKAIRQ